jgi:hypothetical protein
MSERRYEIKDEAGTVKYVLKFRPIHDSRRLHSMGETHNLFLLKGAMCCECVAPNDEYLGSGYSFCYRKDRFDLRKGERTALKRTLRHCFDRLTREDRSFIWAEYFKLRPIKPEPTQRELRKDLRRELMKSSPGERLARKIGWCVQHYGEEATRKAVEQVFNPVRLAESTETDKEVF